MSFQDKIFSIINSILNTVDLNIIRISEINNLYSLRYKYQKLLNRLDVNDELLSKPSHNNLTLPENAETYLQFNNPRLIKLKQEYQSLSNPVIDPSLWTESFVNSKDKLQFFRGDYVYVWQFRDINTELHYWLTTYYVKTIDKLGLLDILEEDNLFGCYTFSIIDNLCVSRDLLDSILEIYFLEQFIKISELSNVKVLDIGAGYGRLAYRMVKGLPNIENFFCVDAVAESTFISEYYLRFRGVNKKAVVIPLYDLENILANESINLAINIHSFSECTLASIKAWLDILQKYKIEYLMIVPNYSHHEETKLLTTEKTGEKFDFFPLIKSSGYKLLVSQPKYLDPVLQKHGVSPTYYYLFQLTY